MDSRRRFDSQDGDMMSTLQNVYFQFQPTNWVICSGSHFSFAIRTLIRSQLETFSITKVVFFLSRFSFSTGNTSSSREKPIYMTRFFSPLRLKSVL